MKILKNILFLTFFSLISLNNIYSQKIINNFNVFSKDLFVNHFPSQFTDVLYYPSTNAVYILPSHEKDKQKQDDFIQFFREEIFIPYILPGLNIKIVTDDEALKMDLTNVNIFAFGTIKGNLWISNFLSKTKDFPIKIKDTTIYADTLYSGVNKTLCATWYNPQNYKHSTFLYVPLDINSKQGFSQLNQISQYAVLQNNKIHMIGNYLLKANAFKCIKNDHYEKYLIDSSNTFVKIRPNYIEEKEKYRKVENTTKLYYCPNSEELSNCTFSMNEILSDTIKIEDINEKFDNINDFAWLKPIAEKYKIIAIGEDPHHMKYSYFFLNRILFALNRYDNYPVLICELPYSWGPYINYYLNIKDDYEAVKFSDSIFTKLRIPVIFSQIRKWNQVNPEKRIIMACSDMEHYLENTINIIVNPFLKKVDPRANLDYSKKDTLKKYITEVEEIIKKAEKENINGQLPFETPEYFRSVFENIKSSIQVSYSRKFMKERYKVMLRNDTSKQFLGNLIKNNKCVFYGGSGHFKILYRNKKPLIETEGTFLARKYEPTKDKMYAINLKVLCCGIEDSVERIKPELKIEAEKEILELYKNNKCAFNDKFINKDAYFENVLEYFLKMGYKQPGYAYRLLAIDFANAEKLGYSGIETWFMAMEYAYMMEYNTTIVIPYSPFGFN